MSLTYSLQFYFSVSCLGVFLIIFNIPQSISRFCILWIIRSFYWCEVYSSIDWFFFRFSDFSHWGYLCWNLYNWCLSPEKISQTRRVDPASVQAPHSILLPRLPVSKRTQSTPAQWRHRGRVLILNNNFCLIPLVYIQEDHVTYKAFFLLFACLCFYEMFYGYVLYISSTIWVHMGTYQIITLLFYFDGGFFLRVLLLDYTCIYVVWQIYIISFSESWLFSSSFSRQAV